MTYRLVIFDFDGTLADSFEWFSGAINLLADRFGFKRVEPGEHAMLRGLAAGEVMKHLRVPLWKAPRIAANMRMLMNRDIRHIRPFDGVGPMLRSLAAHELALGLVSSNSLANIRQIIGHDLVRLFAHIEHGASIFGKAAQLRKIMRKSRIPHSEAIYIGDEIRDLEAARAVGIKFGAIAWGYTNADALAARKPDEMFLKVGDITELLVRCD